MSDAGVSPLPVDASGGGSASATGSSRTPFLSIAEQKERALQKAKAAKAKKKQRAQQAAQQKKQDAVRQKAGRGKEQWNERR